MKTGEIKEIEFYKDLNLPLYNWNQYTTTKDNNWFIVGYDGRQTKIDTPELTQVENFVTDEYFRAINDNSFRNKLQKWAQIDTIKTKYNIVSALVDRCWMGFTKEQEEERFLFFEMLGKWGFKMQYINTDQSKDEARLTEIRTVLEGLETKLRILEAELKKENSGQKTDLIKQLRIATLALGYNQRLKINDLTLIEWIDICKAVEELSQKN